MGNSYDFDNSKRFTHQARSDLFLVTPRTLDESAGLIKSITISAACCMKLFIKVILTRAFTLGTSDHGLSSSSIKRLERYNLTQKY